MSPLAFIREVIVESNKWDQNHIGGKNFMQMVKSQGSAALATVSTNIILPRKRHDELIACEQEAIELRTMLARTKDKRNDKRNVEYEELPRNPLNNKLMCLWHGEGTHDTGMCAYLKKDKKLLKRLEDGEPSTYPRFKAPTSNRQHGNTREQPHPAAGRAQLPHDAARDRIANYQVTHRAKALRQGQRGCNARKRGNAPYIHTATIATSTSSQQAPTPGSNAPSRLND